MPRRGNGQSLSEYGLALALVAVVAIAALFALSAAADSIFSTIGAQVNYYTGNAPSPGSSDAGASLTPSASPSPSPDGSALSFPGTWDAGSASNRLSPLFAVPDGTTVTVHLTEAVSDGNLGVYCTAGSNVWDATPTIGDHVFSILTGSASCFVYSWDGSYYYRPGLAGAGTFVLNP